MKKIFLLLFASSTMLISCNDYLDVNTSTNNPNTNNIAPSAFLASALSTTYRTQAVAMNEYGSVMTNSWAGNVNAFTGGYRTEFTLNFNTNTRSGIWDNLYTGMFNYNNILVYSDPSNEYGNYKAIARIMKSFYMQYIVDLYGNAPYKEASLGLANLRPKYDDDKDIYKDLLLQLDKARTDIAASTASLIPAGNEDIVFRGDMTEWVAFANTLELKILLRMSQSTEVDVVSLRTSRIAALSGKPFLTTDAAINPGYNGESTQGQNPLYQNWGANKDGSSAGTNRNFTVASQYIAKVLMGTESNTHVNSTGILDPRRTRMFAALATGIVGINQGDVTLVAGGTAPAAASRLGGGVTGYLGVDATDRYNNGSGKDGYIMLASESYFLQSEASFRYPSFGGNAKTLFQSGISASFDHYNAPVGTYTFPTLIVAAPYITATNSVLGLGWDGTPNKLEAIMTQKWLAVTGINGIEPFLDQVRTGFPANPFAITAPAGAVKPKRLLYPASEYTANSANVPNVVLSQIFVVNQFTPFWVN
ncbi:SusD/RagB family nutrient-binding outer membrane lipoprotein [Flavobacterium sp.]|uniref:SusD/RagB family nutrient-binding outer membrane lipoprotein n=1 Tax=Flavobacterium sp. TaxID=239 RepID=UPI0037534D6A